MRIVNIRNTLPAQKSSFLIVLSNPLHNLGNFVVNDRLNSSVDCTIVRYQVRAVESSGNNLKGVLGCGGKRATRAELR